MIKTHERRLMPESYAKLDQLPSLTPIVGDSICYETWSGRKLTTQQAHKRLKEGSTVYYTTWEIHRKLELWPEQ